ncbi:aminotransferase class V-fold PLP-dependent enzyme [Adhaeribacter radiodurans]|uniref:phosphoserine transaminase n=1 Tax=Adhaeribacter radiodurans TaxID=2745197 RepID=A0A7L7L616_9BACT|nr:aminotransferase class V-fold PLP-dependent enzyme [Adhaeribacter radiodurans]QMU27965.1 alanine--glyoxylate aminotransferase family protein [Adhaeribacter radiodurans]
MSLPSLNFYPGPSKVYDQVKDYLALAFEEGILGIQHRSEKFVEISKNTVALLKKKLNIPQDYYVFFTSSATECWEIITQSLVKQLSFHVYNGAFGQKWLEYARKLQPNSTGIAFDLNAEINVNELNIPAQTDVICITQNETSNGTQIKENNILNLLNRFPDPLIAVDATSSMAGINLKYIKADIWYASVQKCFGLPAGMGIMVCSPRTIIRAKQLNERRHYNSLVPMYEKMLNFQTTHTPNVLNIYLLNKVLEQRPLIKVIDKDLVQRAQQLYDFFQEQVTSNLTLLVENPDVRSHTVLAIKADPKLVEEVKRNATRHNLTLGNGYGAWAKNSFRVANFPAINDEEYEILKEFFLKYYA